MSRRTRIVATIGPASRDPAMLRALLRAGVDVARLNCSHATAEALRSDVARIRRIASELDRPVGILLDLQGPKIRTGPVSQPLQLVAGDVLTIVMDPDYPASGLRVGTTWPTMAEDVSMGDPVLFADGALSGEVVAVRPDEVDVRIIDGGALGSHKGINMPRTRIRAPSLTDKDIADLEVGLAAGVDYVALSFVRRAADVVDLRARMKASGAGDVPIVAKIEKPEAVAHIDEILAVVDGIMVARGDLGVEIPLSRVPVVQKELIAAANSAGVLVITATQMLDSMERNPRPTRAETTDVANAILDGTDAVMLSGETASGKYPVQAVMMMDDLAREVEASRFHRPPPLEAIPALAGAERTVARAACYAVREIPRPLVVFTWSGTAAVLASKSRPPGPLYALSPSQRVVDRLALAWGVVPLLVPEIQATDDLIAAGERVLLERRLVERGQEIVVLAGNLPFRGATNTMKVEVVDGSFGWVER